MDRAYRTGPVYLLSKLQIEYITFLKGYYYLARMTEVTLQLPLVSIAVGFVSGETRTTN